MVAVSKKKIFPEAIASFFILLFVYTAITKIRDFYSLSYVVSKTPLFGRWSNLIASGIPVAELAVSTLLFVPRWRKGGLLGALMLMSMFTLYILYMMVFARQLPCSCGGVISAIGWKWHLVFNLVCTGFAFMGWLLSRRQIFMSNDSNLYSNKQAQPKT
jgi:Methylamine utilisation protein MauE